MAQEFNYRGYLIKATSYQKDLGKWTPQAVIISQSGTKIKEEAPLTWTEEFDSQTKADSFAIDGAQFYIDNHY